MSKRTVIVKDKAAPGEVQLQVWEVVEPTRSLPLASFTYSVTEVTCLGGRTRMQSSTTRLADGKLVSEKLDGELDGDSYQRLVVQAREEFANQMRLLMSPFSWLLPPPRDRGK